MAKIIKSKLFVSILFVALLCMCFSLVMTLESSAATPTASGSCGDATWEYYESTGELKISGSGELEDFFSSYDEAPWFEAGCEVKHVTIAEGITNITYEAFSCSSLISVEIPSSVTDIEQEAFIGCDSLVSVVFAEGSRLEYIGCSAFEGCDSLTSIEIPSSVGCIDQRAFYGCSSLASIEIPSSVTSICDWAFCHCSSLASVTLLSNEPSVLGYNVFLDSPLEAIYVPASALDSYKSHEGWAEYKDIIFPIEGTGLIPTASGSCGDNATWEYYESTGELKILGSGKMSDYTSSYSSVPWYSYRSKIKTVTIADGITSIGNYAFYKCSLITSIALGNTELTNIGEFAFCYCENLRSIEIPSSVTDLGIWAFAHCYRLENVVFGENIQLAEISERAFLRCEGLTSIEIPSSVTNIGIYAFSGCEKLVEVYNFSDINIVCGVHDPENNGNLGFSAKVIHTSEEESIIENIDGYKFAYIEGKYYFDDQNYIEDTYYLLDYTGSDTELVLPSSFNYKGEEVKEYNIYHYAFSKKSNIKSIQISSAVKSIGRYAFGDCTGITEMTIPASLELLDTAVFSGCDSLSILSVEEGNDNYHSDGNCIIVTEKGKLLAGCKNSIIPTDGSVVEIAELAFDYCDTLESLVIPSSVTSIGPAAFQGCSGLKSIEIPSSVTRIGNFAFSGCSALTSIEFSAKVTNFERYTFQNCTALKSITLLSGTPVTLAENVFARAGIEAIYVPAKAIDAYKAHEDWAEYKDIIFPIDGATVSFGEYKVKKGGTVSVTVSIENNPGIAIASITLDYDKNVFTLKSVENGEIFETLDAGVNLLWSADGDCEGDGVLATLTFEVNENAEEKDYILSARVNESYNEDYENVNLAVSDGKITVYDFVYGDANGDDVISALDVLLLRKYVANYDYSTGASTVTVYAGADANGDGSVNAIDVLLMRKYIANYDYNTGNSTIVLGPNS